MISMQMEYSHESTVQLFEQTATKLIDEYRDTVNTLLERGEQERYCRQVAIERIRKDKSESFYVDKHPERRNDILVMMFTRYREKTTERFGPNQVKVIEWYNEDWPVFLQEEFYGRREGDDGCKWVADWSVVDIARFLALQHAFRQVENVHDAELTKMWARETGPVDSASDSVNQSHQQHRPHGADDNIDVSINNRLLAVLLFRMMLFAGYSATEINDSRLGKLMAHLHNDTSDRYQESCRKAVNHVRKTYFDAEDGKGNAAMTQLASLQTWLQLFTNGSFSRDVEFMLYLQDEMREIELQMR